MEHTLEYKSPPKYSDYRQRHKKNFRNDPMIDKQAFDELSGQPCHYCGVPGPNGIDRIESSKGYELGKCVPACKHCNYVKGNLSLEDFKRWAKRFVEHQTKNPIWD